MKVLVVDASPAQRAVLRAALDEPDVTVDERAQPAQALAAVETTHPDVVLLDLEGDRAAALDAIAAIMRQRPTPILVLTSGPEDWDDARRLGALDAMVRPPATPAGSATLRTRTRWLARIPVVRHARPTPLAVPLMPQPATGCPLVGIAASAGGTAAIATVLAGLGDDFPGCIAIVQHLPVGFAGSFAGLLRDHCALPVTVVDRPLAARPGTVLVAADDRHLEARADGSFLASEAPPVGPHRPSATVLFASLARVQGRAVIGVILSGMGDDGVSGLASLRASGALTIAQDQDAAVYGMPRAAAEAGAATRVLPLDAIAAALIAGVVAAPGAR